AQGTCLFARSLRAGIPGSRPFARWRAPRLALLARRRAVPECGGSRSRARFGRRAALGVSMKPAAFEYHAPESVSDVASLLAEYGDDAKVLAGGQSLVPLLAMRLTRFPHLVDLNRVGELRGVERQNGTLTIKAMTRQS